MFTLSVIYTTFYLLVLLLIFVVTLIQLPTYLLTHVSISTFMVFIQKYTHTRILYLWLFFTLTGLPPIGLFIVKFNILFFLLYQIHFASIFILFLFFLLNMIYYAQLFNFRNFNKPIYSVLTPNLVSTLSANRQPTYSSYFIFLYVLTILFFLVFSIIFFTDIFLIVNFL